MLMVAGVVFENDNENGNGGLSPNCMLLWRLKKPVLPSHSYVIGVWFSWGNQDFKKISPSGPNAQAGLKTTASMDWELMDRNYNILGRPGTFKKWERVYVNVYKWGVPV